MVNQYIVHTLHYIDYCPDHPHQQRLSVYTPFSLLWCMYGFKVANLGLQLIWESGICGLCVSLTNGVISSTLTTISPSVTLHPTFTHTPPHHHSHSTPPSLNTPPHPSLTLHPTITQHSTPPSLTLHPHHHSHSTPPSLNTPPPPPPSGALRTQNHWGQ